MNTTLPDLINDFQGDLAAFFFTFLRIGAAMALLPVLGERTVPVRVRIVLTLALTAVVAPAISGHFQGIDRTPAGYVWLLFSETVFGLALGLILRLFVFSLQVAGAMAAQATSLSQIFAGAAADPQAAFGNVLVIGGLALAVTFGLHVKIAEYLIYSYEYFQPGQMGLAPEISLWTVQRGSHFFALAFSLAAPFVVASLVYNVALGAINRAMPQLLVSFVGAPAITLGGLVLLFLTTPLIFSVWKSAIEAFLANPFGGA